MNHYGIDPKIITEMEISCNEMFFYQYMPIKLAGVATCTPKNIEKRLHPFTHLIGVSCCDFIGSYGLDRFADSYVYLTAKRLFVSPEYNMNRDGWHSDGFMTDDINYIWSDSVPTVFNFTEFDLSQDDKLSIKEMDEQAEPGKNFTYPNKTLLRLDQFVIHKCGELKKGGVRTFCKLSISKDKYDLEGNTHNYLLDYNWPMRKRGEERNIPQNV